MGTEATHNMFRTLLLILGVASAIATPMFSDPVNTDAGDVDETLAEMYDSSDSAVFKFETRETREAEALVAESTRAMGSGGTTSPTESPTESPTYGCVDKYEDDGSEWHDSDGEQYDCTWYGDYNGCSAYGDGYSYGNYTANQACCTCGGGDTETGSPTNSPTDWPTNYPTESPTEYPTQYPTDNQTQYPTDYPTYEPSQAAECEDYTTENGTDWYDSDGETYTCEWYQDTEGACDAYGSGFDDDGYTASQACCTCGGGTTGSDSGSGSTESSSDSEGGGRRRRRRRKEEEESESESDHEESESMEEEDDLLVQEHAKLAPIQAPKAELIAKLIKSRTAPSVESVLPEK